MMNLITGLPNAILSANGEPIFLNTDYRIWIRFWKDIQKDDEDRDISYLFKDKPPMIDNYILEQLMQFLYNPSSTPKSDNTESEKVLDYVEDGEYIYSALYATYGIDIVDMEMHWHKFLALCNNVIGESTLWGLAKAVRGYHKPPRNYNEHRRYTQLKDAWSFPIELTAEEKRLKQEFDDYFDV